MQILHDDDVLRLLAPTESLAVLETFFMQRAQGDYTGAPRWHLPFGREKHLTLTPGGGGAHIGFRAYLRGSGFAQNDQLTAVWDVQSGALDGIVVGPLLGAMRTGAIGGVAAKHLARFEATRVALIGTGRQAYTQLRHVLAARIAVDEVRVHSRTPEHRAAFVADMADLLPKRLRLVDAESAEVAVRGADIIIGATNSTTPVIRGEWLKPGAHVTTVGPKGATLRETDPEVVARADFIATDSPEQARASAAGLITDGTTKPLYDLAAVVSRQAGRPSDESITLFISTGLAGTEVALAAHLLRKAAR